MGTDWTGVNHFLGLLTMPHPGPVSETCQVSCWLGESGT